MGSSYFSNLIYNKSEPILFTSGFFLLIFTLFILIYSFVYKRKSFRTVYVVLFSLYFYYKTSGDFVIVLLGSIVVNYIIALVIDVADSKRLKLFTFIYGILINIISLAYFKYINFIIDNINIILSGKIHNIDIIFPIGISFYTFQSISYLTDVYRENIKPADKITDYAFYVSFFPYIIAGPIVRASDLLPQNSEKLIIRKEDVDTGFYLIVRGLIKKGIFSYYISQYCDLIYGAPANFSGLENLIAMLGYTVDIYLDFSGYSDIAIGLAGIMGFRLKPNFNSPYKSKNLTEFWKRWHISLSTWLRDYLFLPLTYFYLRHSKNKKISLLHSYIFATMITMFIAGLWHGPSYKYIFWGTIHGLGLTVNRTYLYFTKKKIRKILIPDLLGKLITLTFVSVAWVFFRANSFDDAFISLHSILFNFDIAYLLPFYDARSLFSILFIVSIILIFSPEYLKQKVQFLVSESPVYVKAVIFIIILQILIQIQTESIQPFIYYQF